MSDLSCPNCGAGLDLMTVFGHEADNRALARLASVSVPLGARVLQYVQLHQPLRQRLTARKKIKLLLELLPDLERRAIAHKGRDWAAPLNAWADAIDQMLAARDAGRLELPIKGHGYLYAVMAAHAARHEAAAEKEREQLARARSVARRGQTQSVAAAFASSQEAHATPPVTPPVTPPPVPGTSPTVRAMRAEIERARALRQGGDAAGPHPNPPPAGEGARGRPLPAGEGARGAAGQSPVGAAQAANSAGQAKAAATDFARIMWRAPPLLQRHPPPPPEE